jgi:hypothetical protein
VDQRVQQVAPENYLRSPFPLRVAGPQDAPFVSALVGQDASAYMARVTTLISDHGFFFLEPITSSVLEAHMQFDKPGRGREALHAARAGLRHAFDAMGALVVFGRIPVEDRAARLFTRMIGLRSEGVRPSAPDGPLVEWFELRKDEICRLQSR